jgi:hypothetical protein
MQRMSICLHVEQGNKANICAQADAEYLGKRIYAIGPPARHSGFDRSAHHAALSRPRQ